MGLFDKVKSKFGRSKHTPSPVRRAKGDETSDAVEPDAVEKVVPGENSPAE